MNVGRHSRDLTGIVKVWEPSQPSPVLLVTTQRAQTHEHVIQRFLGPRNLLRQSQALYLNHF